MKLTKYDWIQLGFNILLIIATVLNAMYLMGIVPQWFTLIGFGLAIIGCVMTNVTATGNKSGMRAEVKGNKFLAGLTYVTGVLWVVSYGITVFLRIDMGGR